VQIVAHKPSLAYIMAHTTFPSTLPVPKDDGACDHLTGFAVPDITVSSTSGTTVDPFSLPGLTIIFCYPRTGAPGETIPDEWNSIPGARGCTPQACSFRDLLPELKSHGVANVFGLSTQSTAYQSEVKQRVALTYDLVSDEKLEVAKALKLPTFEWEGNTLIRRLTLAVEDGKVKKVWYPVFPPDKSAAEVLEWLEKEYKK